MKKIMKLTLFFVAIAAGKQTLSGDAQTFASQALMSKANQGPIIGGPVGAPPVRLGSGNGTVHYGPVSPLSTIAQQLTDTLNKSPKEQHVNIITNYFQQILSANAQNIAKTAVQGAKIQSLFKIRTDNLPTGASPGIVEGRPVYVNKTPVQYYDSNAASTDAATDKDMQDRPVFRGIGPVILSQDSNDDKVKVQGLYGLSPAWDSRKKDDHKEDNAESL